MDHPQAEDIVEILEAINSDFLKPPADKRRIKQWLEMISPHVQAAGKDVQASYIAATKRLVDGHTSLIDPTTGEKVD